VLLANRKTISRIAALFVQKKIVNFSYLKEILFQKKIGIFRNRVSGSIRRLRNLNCQRDVLIETPAAEI